MLNKKICTYKQNCLIEVSQKNILWKSVGGNPREREGGRDNRSVDLGVRYVINYINFINYVNDI